MSSPTYDHCIDDKNDFPTENCMSWSPHSVTQQANLLNAVIVQTYYKESRSKDTAKEYTEMDKAG